MKRILAMIVLLVGCQSSAAGAAGSAALDASPTRATVEETVVLDAAPAPTVKLLDFDGGAAPSAKGGGVLLCELHSVWKPAEGFVATKIAEGFVSRNATAPDELVAILFPPHAEDSYATVVAKLASGAIAWDSPVMTKIDEWHAESIAHGHASNLSFATRTLYAGVDPKTGKGRVGREIQATNRDVVWITAAKTDARADALLVDAKKQTLMLVDHACECGYDCLPR